MSCPFFSPTNRADDLRFPHPARLPLGAAWRGTCCAPGQNSSPEPSDQELESCNLGYAKSCPRLPRERDCDAIRFVVMKDSPDRLTVQFVFELNYLPAAVGLLEYDRKLRLWIKPHPQSQTQKLADTFLQSYLLREKFNSSTSEIA